MPSVLQYDVPEIDKNSVRKRFLEQYRELDNFLASIQIRAFRMAEVATGNRDDAFDILQDAMYRFVQKYSEHSRDEWVPLFYRVLQNRIRDWHRREKVLKRFRIWFGRPGDEPEADGLEKIADERAATPEQELHNARSMKILEQAIRKLPVRQQQALMLRVFEGLDVEQTAKAMGCTTGSVKTHYSRAVHTLREKLEGYWP